MSKYIGSRIVPKHCGKWEKAKPYEVLSIVLDETTGNSYMARKNVPVGTELKDEAYWALSSKYSEQVHQTQLQVKKQEENLSELVKEAKKASEKATSSLDSAKQLFESRMDSIIKGTQNPEGYESEVMDARIDSSGKIHDSLGTAIRTREEQLDEILFYDEVKDIDITELIGKIEGSYTGYGGQVKEYAGADTTERYPVKEGDTFYLSCDYYQDVAPISEYNAEGKFMNNPLEHTMERTFLEAYEYVVPKGVSFVAFSTYHRRMNPLKVVKKQKISVRDKQEKLTSIHNLFLDGRVYENYYCSSKGTITHISQDGYAYVIVPVKENTRYSIWRNAPIFLFDQRYGMLIFLDKHREVIKALNGITCIAEKEFRYRHYLTVETPTACAFLCMTVGFTGSYELDCRRVEDCVIMEGEEISERLLEGETGKIYDYHLADSLARKSIKDIQKRMDSLVDYELEELTDYEAFRGFYYFRNEEYVANGSYQTRTIVTPELPVTYSITGSTNGADMALATLLDADDHVLECYWIGSNSGVENYTDNRFTVTNPACKKIVFCASTASQLFISTVIPMKRKSAKEYEERFGVLETKTLEMSETIDALSEGIYAGKSWAVFGDSLTEKNYRAVTSYYDCVHEETGIGIVNYGISGTGFVRRQDVGRAFYQRMLTIDPNKFDVLTIFASGNDKSSGVEIGNPTDAGTETICGCINTTLDNYFSIAPFKPIGLVTPCPWSSFNPKNAGNWMEQYSEAIIAIGRMRGIPVLDMYHISGLRPWEEKFRAEFYVENEITDPGVHPNSKGHRIFLYPKFREFLRTLL